MFEVAGQMPTSLKSGNRSKQNNVHAQLLDRIAEDGDRTASIRKLRAMVNNHAETDPFAGE